MNETMTNAFSVKAEQTEQPTYFFILRHKRDVWDPAREPKFGHPWAKCQKSGGFDTLLLFLFGRGR